VSQGQSIPKIPNTTLGADDKTVRSWLPKADKERAREKSPTIIIIIIIPNKESWMLENYVFWLITANGFSVENRSVVINKIKK